MRFTRSESVVYRAVLARPAGITIDGIMTQLYGHLPNGGSENADNTIRQFIHRVNKKIERFEQRVTVRQGLVKLELIEKVRA